MNKKQEKLKEVSRVWSIVYDNFSPAKAKRDSVWKEEPTPFFRRLIPWLKDQGVKSYGIMGCGDGRNIKPFLDAGFNVTAIDGSESAIKACKILFMPNKNLTLMQELLEDTKLKDNNLDTLMCDHVLVHIENIKEVLKEFFRVVKPGGYVLIEFSSPEDSAFKQGEKISNKERIQGEYYLRFDTLPEAKAHMKDFEILTITSEYSTDPDHGIAYVRKMNVRHEHHSYFVLARKPR
jgi:ubiquinone/menaquinone biosynthesis C-methylase UbiE